MIYRIRHVRLDDDGHVCWEVSEIYPRFLSKRRKTKWKTSMTSSGAYSG